MNKFVFIDWTATVARFGYSEKKLKPQDKVITPCQTCKVEIIRTFFSIRKRKTGPFESICKSCQQKRTWRNKGFRENQSIKQSIAMQKVWRNEDYRANLSAKVCENTKKHWQNQEFRNKVVAGVKKAHADNPDYTRKTVAVMHTPIARAKSVASTIERYKDPAYAKKISDANKAKWQDPTFRAKMMAKFSTVEYRTKCSLAIKKLWRDNPEYAKAVLENTKSKQEDQLAKYMRDFGIKYAEQFKFGPWAYDFFLPDHNLLIEVNGDYFHRQKIQMLRDASKATYAAKYSAHKLMVIWEHEFLTSGRVQKLLLELDKKHKPPQVDFSFDDVEFKTSLLAKDCVVFLSRYHYTASGGRNGINFGCYYKNELIACARFCNPTRAESAKRLQLTQKELKELTRFAIHPSYQKKNFASWFLSRCIKSLKQDKTIKCLLTFADTTQEHDGTIYKASNWVYDGEIPPDYHYIDKDGFVMHKRTLWSHSSKLRISESDYATQFGYEKRFGKSKHRFIFWF